MSEEMEPVVVITPKLELTIEQWGWLVEIHKEHNSCLMEDGDSPQTLTEFLGDIIDNFIRSERKG